MERHKIYYALLEATIFLGVLYTFGIINLLNAPWLTQHISNLIGSIFLTLVIIGPNAFKRKAVVKVYVAIFIVAGVNAALELSRPVGTIDLPYFTWQNFNTPDPIDAVFGFIGILIVVLFHILARHKADNTTHSISM